jgi:hypothetical protein
MQETAGFQSGSAILGLITNANVNVSKNPGAPAQDPAVIDESNAEPMI